jgi:hypothetical protein
MREVNTSRQSWHCNITLHICTYVTESKSIKTRISFSKTTSTSHYIYVKLHGASILEQISVNDKMCFRHNCYVFFHSSVDNPVPNHCTKLLRMLTHPPAQHTREHSYTSRTLLCGMIGIGVFTVYFDTFLRLEFTKFSSYPRLLLPSWSFMMSCNKVRLQTRLMASFSEPELYSFTVYWFIIKRINLFLVFMHMPKVFWYFRINVRSKHGIHKIN